MSRPTTILTDVLLRVYHEDDTSETHLIRPVETTAVIGGSSRGERAASYFRLGVQHILMGVDHLLFVLGLLLIVQYRWILVKTITSFTVAHSITLAIATLGYASAPLPPLNAAIALSILFMAVILIFGRKVMVFYGQEFGRGYPALCILAAGVAESVKFAMAPLALQFFGKARWVLKAICVAGLVNTVLLAALGGLYGATGAAVACSVSLGGMSLTMYFKALSYIRQQQAAMPETAAGTDQ